MRQEDKIKIKRAIDRLNRDANNAWKLFISKNKLNNKGNKSLKKVKKKKNRKQRKRIPRKYEDYIKSTFWEDRKKEFFKKVKRQCVACDSFKFIIVHHMYYGEWGKEEDTHLIPLCRDCHNEYHTLNGVQRNMITRTNEFIKEKQDKKLLQSI